MKLDEIESFTTSPSGVEAPFDRAVALAHRKAKLGTMTGRGFVEPPFGALVFGPVVGSDLIENRSSRR